MIGIGHVRQVLINAHSSVKPRIGYTLNVQEGEHDDPRSVQILHLDGYWCAFTVKFRIHYDSRSRLNRPIGLISIRGTKVVRLLHYKHPCSKWLSTSLPMVRFYFPLFVLFAAGIAASFFGCEGMRTDGAPSGRVQVMLKDSPLDGVEELRMTIDRVELIGVGADGESTLLVLSDEARQLDVRQWQDGEAQLLADASVPPGSYDKLRLVLSDLTTVSFYDGPRRDVRVTSDSGLNILVPSIDINSAGDVAHGRGAIRSRAGHAERFAVGWCGRAQDDDRQG